MTILGELNDLLNRMPVWKQLMALPARVASLEARMAALEGVGPSPLPFCPICREGRLRTIEVRSDPTMGEVGVQQHVMRCDAPACGHSQTRQVDPTQG